jgi:hypothetical protein
VRLRRASCSPRTWSRPCTRGARIARRCRSTRIAAARTSARVPRSACCCNAEFAGRGSCAR